MTHIARTAASDRHGSFELTIDGKVSGHLSYSIATDQKKDQTLEIEYVEVNPSLRGKGVGKQLVDAAVAWAREQGRRVEPLCSYARAVMSRSKEYDDVLRG
jgi:predicted GNAT family acetyltransferase